LKSFKGESVLVTGGAGFIGSHIVDRLMSEGASVRVLDDLSNGNMANLSLWKDNKNLEFIVGDIRDKRTVETALKDIEVVFHQAAKVSVPMSVKNPLLVMDVNAMGSATLLDGCRRGDINKIVVASSSSVYGDTPILPKEETMPTLPLSPYAVSKLSEETLAIAFHSTYGLNSTALRYFNVYGPRQRGGSYAGVMYIFISKALQNEPLPIEGDGQQSRDFTFIDDVVVCNILAAESSKSGGNVYTVGGGGRITIDKLADEIIVATDSMSTKRFIDPRPGDVRNSLASLVKVNADLGYSPRWNISRGLAKTVDWMKTKGP
jgi:nucleoside-diphosphate-sugar epimerase